MSEISKVYWKRGARLSIDPKKAFLELERIKAKNADKLTAGIVVIEARKARSPLHKAFEWDDSVAAEEYRLVQARKMLRSIEVVYAETPHIPPTRGYITVTEPAKQDIPERKIYLSTAEALKDPVARDELLGNAIRDALTYRRKYASLSELAKIFVAIDTTIEHIKVG